MSVYHWLALRFRRDWELREASPGFQLRLRSTPPPGWYMLTVCYFGEQPRCYARFNGSQGRLLRPGRLRRRLVRIPARDRQVCLELHGLNGEAALPVLRLVPQPPWRVRQLLRRKLRRLHPRYGSSASLALPLPKLWSEYNRLLSGANRQLLGYDEWIERRERRTLAPPLAAVSDRSGPPTASPPRLRFLPFLWGGAPGEGGASASLRSLERQWPGSFQRLEASQATGINAQATAINAPDTWLVLLQSGDQLAPQALCRCSEALLLHPEARVLYADEDRLSQGGRRHSPHFKPSWNPELLYGDPHYSHCWLIRSDLVQRILRELDAAGETLSLYALVLEATAAVRPEQILHIPQVLYHRVDRPGERRGDADSAATVARFLARRHHAIPVTARSGGGHCLHWPIPDPPPLVSVIIPSRDRSDLLRCCVDSLHATASGNPPTELLLIDNGSSDPASLAYLEELASQPGVRLLRRPGPFNYAALNNEAARLARGEVLTFLNNDVEALQPGWLTRMVAEALRPGIGAVGARLLYEDGTVQHAGVVLGIGGVAGHAHKTMNAEAEGYQLRLRLTHQVSAVTAAALVLRKSIFIELGGFDGIHFAVNYNDVDLCLRLMARGYRNLYCADAVLIHRESRSRGAPVSSEPFAQWRREYAAMQKRWGKLLLSDPHYSPHLSLVEENFSLAIPKEVPLARPGGMPTEFREVKP